MQCSNPGIWWKDLEDGDCVSDAGKAGVKVQGFSEGEPCLPVFVSCCSMARNNAGSDHCLDKTEISAKFISSCRVKSFQEMGCG